MGGPLTGGDTTLSLKAAGSLIICPAHNEKAPEAPKQMINVSSRCVGVAAVERFAKTNDGGEGAGRCVVGLGCGAPWCSILYGGPSSHSSNNNHQVEQSAKRQEL